MDNVTIYAIEMSNSYFFQPSRLTRRSTLPTTCARTENRTVTQLQAKLLSKEDTRSEKEAGCGFMPSV